MLLSQPDGIQPCAELLRRAVIVLHGADRYIRGHVDARLQLFQQLQVAPVAAAPVDAEIHQILAGEISPLEEIDEYVKRGGSAFNEAKERLAYILTEMIHSKEDADLALKTSRELFSGAASSENMPSAVLPEDKFVDGKIAILDLLVATKLAPSKSEARRLVTQGGILVNDEKVDSIDATFEKVAFEGTFIVKKGKKTFLKVTL